MNFEAYETAKSHLMDFAEMCIIGAEAAVRLVNRHGEPVDELFDPESWNVIKINAQRIINACENDDPVSEAWIEAIYSERNSLAEKYERPE